MKDSRTIIIPQKRGNGFTDLTGQRFGKLLVVDYAGSELVSKYPRKYKSVWKVHCDCGTEKVVRGADMKKNKQVSCGCHKEAQTAAFNVRTKTKTTCSTFSMVWQSYRQGAKKRELVFELLKDEFWVLTQRNCEYCGIPPTQERTPRIKGKINNFIYNGVDRIDSTKGYTLDNCAPCCKLCNMMKRDLPIEEFNLHIERIYKNYELRRNS